MDAIVAGYLIGLSAYIAKQTTAPWNAILFGVGLLTICTCKLPLFTGKVGELKIRSLDDICTIMCILRDNWCGALFWWMFVLFLPSNLLAGIVCGSLIQIAVVLYQKYPWAVVYCIMAFIMAGGKHCIAMVTFPEFTAEFAWALVQVIIGNIIGARIVAFGGIRRS